MDFSILVKGGIVMIPLLACSLVSMAILFERMYFYKKCHTDISTLRKAMTQYIPQKNWTALQDSCDMVGGKAAEMVGEAILYDKSINVQEKFVDMKASFIAGELQNYLSYLSTIVTLAPLMGLLGTVTGMISSFNVLATAEGQPFAITGGVSEALIATATGLCVAIIALVIHTYLKQRQNSLLDEIEEVGALYILTLVGDRHEA
ncbi:MotA/TolQ/ExbB proton channel family protein [Veillonella magna]|uniref:MotA/TolQ/ExbB proton channel family protein n=1 Tax=Veillonella magna TaxID=464322 RepID=UPI002666750C|nr:MotA/TolQ/ExbB proton channel family protein [Veillonella magna]